MSTRFTPEQLRKMATELDDGNYRDWTVAPMLRQAADDAERLANLGEAKVAAWFPAYADGEILRHFSDGRAVPASTTKEHAEQVRLYHLSTSGRPVVPLYIHPAPAKVNRQDRIAVSRALDGLKDRLFDANALDTEAMALHSAGSDAFFRITAPTSNKE